MKRRAFIKAAMFGGVVATVPLVSSVAQAKRAVTLSPRDLKAFSCEGGELVARYAYLIIDDGGEPIKWPDDVEWWFCDEPAAT